MRTFIANFGHGNNLWPECLERSTVATFVDEDLQPFVEAGDREGFIEWCVRTRISAAGTPPIKPVASRWFSLTGIVEGTADDLWIHREKNELWWTVTLPDRVQVEVQAAQTGSVVEKVFVIHKPARPWSNRSKSGARLEWLALHPKARDFLFTESTFQKLSDQNAAYARDLVDGADLKRWHERPEWRVKAESARRGAAEIFEARKRAAVRMVMTAAQTAAASNGQQVLRTVKNKEVRFANQLEFERYVRALLDSQEGLCAITGLPLQFDGEFDDIELLCSLDRIDSDGHYEPGNLQVVCRFVNRWKSDGDDGAFRRLIGLVRRSE